jgi:hypothetical protein
MGYHREYRSDPLSLPMQIYHPAPRVTLPVTDRSLDRRGRDGRCVSFAAGYLSQSLKFHPRDRLQPLTALHGHKSDRQVQAAVIASCDATYWSSAWGLLVSSPPYCKERPTSVGIATPFGSENSSYSTPKCEWVGRQVAPTLTISNAAVPRSQSAKADVVFSFCKSYRRSFSHPCRMKRELTK